jgi:ketosteroid isomerase-like protein
MAEFSQAEMRNVEAACYALAAEYAEIVDSQDYARLREIFADDAVFARPTSPQDPIRGAENIVASFESRPRNRVTQHFVTNIRVRVESPTAATGSCRILLYMCDASEPETPEGRRVAPKQLIGMYLDRFVRTKDGWRFAERRGKTLFHT